MLSQRSDTLAAVSRETEVLVADAIETSVTTHKARAARRF